MIRQHPYITATLAATLLSIVVWLCVPKEYTAVTKLSDEYKEMDLGIGLDGIMVHFREVTGSANKGINNMDTYSQILKTEDFARSIANKQVHGKGMSYGEYLNVKDTIETVLEHINYNYSGKQETLSIAFSDRDPLIAAQMLDSVTSQLQAIVTKSRSEMALAKLNDAQKHLSTAREKYVKASNDYSSFLDSHNNPTIKRESQQAYHLEREVDMAYKEYEKANKQHVRELAITKRSYLSFAVIENNHVPLFPNSYFISYLFSFLFIGLAITHGIKLYNQCKLNNEIIIDWKGIMSPWCITFLIWLFLLGLYFLIDTDLYPIKKQFYICLFIWVPLLCGTSFVTYNLAPTHRSPSPSFYFNIHIFYFFLIISIIITPVHLYRIIQIALMFSSDDLANNLRLLALYGDGYGIWGHSSIINQALFVVAIWAYPRIPMWQIVLIGIACLLNSLAIMEKGSIFFLFTCIATVLLYRKVIGIRSLTIAGGILFCVFFIFNVIRSSNSNDSANDYDIMTFIGMYILSPPVAFCQLSFENIQQFGTNTFETIYAIINRLGLGNFIAKEKLQDFVFVPVSTNVYTIFQPFYIDFGYRGVAFFAVVYGLFAGWFYKLFNNRNSIGVCFYTYAIYALVLQFYQENIFLSFQFMIEWGLFIVLFCQNKIHFTISKTHYAINKKTG